MSARNDRNRQHLVGRVADALRARIDAKPAPGSARVRHQRGGLDLRKPSDASSWMELAQRLHHRFGPVSRQWPTGVTCFAVSASTPPGGGELQLVLVSATSGMEGVADCVPAAQAPGTGAQA